MKTGMNFICSYIFVNANPAATNKKCFSDYFIEGKTIDQTALKRVGNISITVFNRSDLRLESNSSTNFKKGKQF